MERKTGLEPATLGLGSRCSTTEPLPHRTYLNTYNGALNRTLPETSLLTEPQNWRSEALSWCPNSDSNQGHGDFQSPALPTELSGHKTWSGRRDSNSRPSPWQGDALPLSHFRAYCVLNDRKTNPEQPHTINGDPERARTVDLQRDRLAF